MSDAIEAVILSTNESGTRSGGIKRTVTFRLPPDGEHPFKGLAGYRVGLAVALIGDNDALRATEAKQVPAESGAVADAARGDGSPYDPRHTPPARPKDGDKAGHSRTLNGSAHALCKRADFQAWLCKRLPVAWRDNSADGRNAEAVAAAVIKEHCNVISRGMLDHDPAAAVAFNALKGLFYDETRLPEQR